MTGEWNLALAAVGGVIGILMLGLTMARHLADHLDRRFAEAEARRQEASGAWSERFAAREEALNRLTARIDAAMAEHVELYQALSGLREHCQQLRAEAASTYVTQETFFAEAGRNMIKLDKILERLPPKETLHHG